MRPATTFLWLFTTLFTRDAHGESCPNTFNPPANKVYSGGTSCYSAFGGLRSYSEAKALCESGGAHILFLTNEAKRSDVLAGFPNYEHTWVGLEKIANVWMWVDGTVQETVGTSYFRSGEAAYDRAVADDFQADSNWLGVSQSAQYRVMCEREHTLATVAATDQTSTIPQVETTTMRTTTTAAAAALITTLPQTAVTNATMETSAMTEEMTSNAESTTISDTSTTNVIYTDLSQSTTSSMPYVPDEMTSNGESTAINDASTTNVTYTELSTSANNLTLSEENRESQGTPSFGSGMAIGAGSGMATAGVLVLMVKGIKFLRAGAKTMPTTVKPGIIKPDSVENGVKPDKQAHVGENAKDGSNQNKVRQEDDMSSVSSLSLDTDNIKVIAMGIYTNYETVGFTIADNWNIKRHTASLKNVTPERRKPHQTANLHFDVTASQKQKK